MAEVIEQQKDEFAATQVTPEAVAAMKARVGMATAFFEPLETTTEAHIDTMRRYALGIGDDNPLWCDPDYGFSTRWNSPVAFPTYAVGGLEERLPDAMQLVPKGDPLKGLHSFVIGFETTYYRPIYPGDRTSSLSIIESVEEKPSRFAGTSVRVVRLTRVKNQRGDIVRTIRVPLVHVARTPRDKQKKTDYEPPFYTPDDIAKIDAAYEAERRRGAEPRYWEDVTIGEAIDPIVKGPYSLKDWIGYCVGTGTFGVFGGGAWRLDYMNRKRMPRFYTPVPSTGIPLSAFACHFDLEVAQKAGVPQCYDVGAMRQAFLTQMLTNWMGDDGFVFRTNMEFRQFNYLGDVQWCEGKVTGKRSEGDLNIVDIEMSCTNQRGAKTTLGTAAVLLPSREHGPVKLPDAPRNLP
jgi:acyl dehydratase